MIGMSDLPLDMDMDSPVDMQEMDIEQDDNNMNAPPPPHAVSRIPMKQLPSVSPPTIRTVKFATPLKPQDVIIKPYNPKGKFIFMN
jgi:hypothetical protein